MITMFEVGDCVVFLLDGTRGTVMETGEGLYHVAWEDQFVSWEREELLEKVQLRI
ncbi:hypothetical protein SAMN05518855_100719 [Paenibacillus sp. CF384]|nr:hypothetical protein SAMN05518855_100719 [Paenibacillus sp. CF384]